MLSRQFGWLVEANELVQIKRNIPLFPFPQSEISHVLKQKVVNKYCCYYQEYFLLDSRVEREFYSKFVRFAAEFSHKSSEKVGNTSDNFIISVIDTINQFSTVIETSAEAESTALAHLR